MTMISPASPDNDAIRELHDELKDLNKTLKKSGKVTERYTVVLMIFAMIQILVALVPIGMGMTNVPEKYEAWANLGWILVLIFGGYKIIEFGDQVYHQRKLWDKKEKGGLTTVSSNNLGVAK